MIKGKKKCFGVAGVVGQIGGQRSEARCRIRNHLGQKLFLDSGFGLLISDL